MVVFHVKLKAGLGTSGLTSKFLHVEGSLKLEKMTSAPTVLMGKFLLNVYLCNVDNGEASIDKGSQKAHHCTFFLVSACFTRLNTSTVHIQVLPATMINQ